MRYKRESHFGHGRFPHPGSLLLAHPSLLDANFCRAVVLLSAHSDQEGSIGVIVNRPMGQTLGEFDPALSESPLSGVPLYSGGPVGTDQLILVAWNWSEEESAFRLYFGIDAKRAERIFKEEDSFNLRGFLGHSGWSGGQLKEEFAQGAWLLSSSLPRLSENEFNIDWHELLCNERPKLRLLADNPKDSFRN